MELVRDVKHALLTQGQSPQNVVIVLVTSTSSDKKNLMKTNVNNNNNYNNNGDNSNDCNHIIMTILIITKYFDLSKTKHAKHGRQTSV